MSEHDRGGTDRDAGQDIRRRIGLALALSAVIPLLILTYAVSVHVIPLLDPAVHTRERVALQALLVFTGLLVAAGAVVIRDLVGGLARADEAGRAAHELERAARTRADELGALMSSFARLLGSIEAPAARPADVIERLERAYRELEQTNARLKEFSFKDDVTGLYNRRFFGIRLQEEVGRYRRFGHPLSVVLLDLDGFKAVNDALGHAAGDQTLRVVGDILLRYSRGINVLCRWGGDEFAVLLVETGKAGAESYAKRIRQVLADYPFAHGLRITASFGVATLPDDVPPEAEALVRAADAALYAAKRAGKNRVALAEGPVVTAAPSIESEVQAV
jgi:diguanylate cyclase (GGDEF)-like protein